MTSNHQFELMVGVLVEMDYRRRLKGLQDKMEEQEIDVVIYGSCQNFQYLTGLLTEWRRGVDLQSPNSNVFVPKNGEPILTVGGVGIGSAEDCWINDVRLLERGSNLGEVIGSIAGDLDWREGRVAIGDHLWGSTLIEVARHFKGGKFRIGKDLMNDLRMIKEPAEIELLRRVGKLTDDVMEKIISGIKEGDTQKDLQLEIELVGRKMGAKDISFGPTAGFVKSGSEPTENPFTYPKDKGLVAGTSIAFDIGFVMDGYCSDWGRSMYYGSATEDVKKGYEELMQSVVTTVDKMAEGSMSVNEIFPSIEGYLDSVGYGDHLRARLKTGTVGHQIGVEVHENPWLKPNETKELKAGMVMCLEPKLLNRGEYYLRVEDMVLVKKDKAEFLTNYDREQFLL